MQQKEQEKPVFPVIVARTEIDSLMKYFLKPGLTKPTLIRTTSQYCSNNPFFFFSLETVESEIKIDAKTRFVEGVLMDWDTGSKCVSTDQT